MAEGSEIFVNDCNLPFADETVGTNLEHSRSSFDPLTQIKKQIKWEYDDEDFVKNWPTLSTEKPPDVGGVDCDLGLFSPKGKGPAVVIKTILEAWSLLIDEPILLIIEKNTNEQIRSKRGHAAFQRTTDVTEIRAWIGLTYLCGVLRNSACPGPLDELWTPELGNIIFRATMSFKRFEFLTDCIRFGKSNDKQDNTIEKVSDIWQKFAINCRSYYTPSTVCAIDEYIVNVTDSKCPFKFSLPPNSIRMDENSQMGLRLVCLCDTKTLYMLNVLLATEEDSNEEEVSHLVCDIKNTQRHVILTERYGTLDIAKNLLNNNLFPLGALNQSDISKTILRSTPLYATGEISLTLMPCPLNSTNSILSSDLSNINTEKLYKATHLTCKNFQKLTSKYSTRFSTAPTVRPRWDLELFYTILNYAVFNSWILYLLSEHQEDATIEQRDFQRQLGLHLVLQHLKRRLRHGSATMSLSQKIHIYDILGEPTENLISEFLSNKKRRNLSEGIVNSEKANALGDIELVSRFGAKRQRCRKCLGKNVPKTRIRCQQCERFLCYRHLIVRCDDCTGVNVPSY